MENRDVKSLARYYNTKRTVVSKWLVIIAVIIGLIAFLMRSNVIVMPIALILSYILIVALYYGAKIWAAKKYKEKDPELYKEILLDGYEKHSEYNSKKRNNILNYKHLIIFVIACAIGPTILFIGNKIDSSMTLKMKEAISTQHNKFKYIDYLHIMKDEKRVDTLCFYEDEEGTLSMSSLITFTEEDWYIFWYFGPIYDGFSTVYVDPHYKYMTKLHVCNSKTDIPPSAYLSYEIDGLFIYIIDIVQLSPYESDVWYGATITGESRNFELNTLLTVREILSENLEEFEILDLAWIRKDWKFADYLCIYSTPENELNTAVFTKDKNKDICDFRTTFEGLKLGETYFYTESRNMYNIGYCFYENRVDVPKDAYYIEEIQVNQRDLWIGVIRIEEVVSE